jgi:hypothetical protein
MPGNEHWFEVERSGDLRECGESNIGDAGLDPGDMGLRHSEERAKLGLREIS